MQSVMFDVFGGGRLKSSSSMYVYLVERQIDLENALNFSYCCQLCNIEDGEMSTSLS